MKNFRHGLVTALVLLPLAASPTAAADDVSPLIVGGREAAELPPGAVSLALDGYPGPFCGGTLVDPDTVVTAAHCVFQLEHAPEDVLKPIDQMRVGYGSLRSTGGPSVRVRGIEVHPDWRFGQPPGPTADVAVVRLAQEVPRDVAIGRIAAHRPAPRTPVTLTGWGNTTPDGQGTGSPVLRDATTRVADDVRCAPGITGGELCVADEAPHVTNEHEGVSACFGDSGSAAWVSGPDGTRPRMVGLTSRSPADTGDTPCDGRPDIYTDLTAYRGWIEQVR